MRTDESGAIRTILSNFAALSEIDTSYRRTFHQEWAPRYIEELVSGAESLFEEAEEYFDDLRKEESALSRRQYLDLIEEIKAGLFLSIGWDILQRQVQASSPLAALLSEYGPAEEMKGIAHKAVALGRTSLAELQEAMRQALVEGGLIRRWIDAKMPDAIDQFDRMAQYNVAEALGIRYAIYEGGIIETSREFCEVRNAGVFTEDEIKLFGTPDDKFGGYSNKPLGEFRGKYKNGYDPIRDLGGYNCRHFLIWITQDLAFRLRPDLSEGTPPPAVPEGPPPPVAPLAPAAKKPRKKRSSSDLSKFTEEQRLLIEEWRKKLGSRRAKLVSAEYLAMIPRINGKIIRAGGQGSYYHFDGDLIAFIRKGKFGTALAESKTIYHELAHVYHFKKGLISPTFVSDKIKEYFEKAEKLIRSTLWGGPHKMESRLDDDFLNFHLILDDEERKNFLWKHLATADTLASLTSGAFGQGHPLSYWNYSNRTYMEFFAHAVENYFVGNSYFKETFPELHDLMIEMVKDTMFE